MTLTGRRVDVKLLYNSVHRKFNRLERRCWNEEHVPERLGPRPPVEQPRRTGKKRCYGHKSGGCSSVQPPTHLSHSKTFSNPFEPFQIK